MRRAAWRLAVAVILLWAGWDGARAAEARYYRFGVLPLQSPTMLAKMFLPLTDALARGLDHPVEFVTAPSFASFMRRVRRGEYDIIYLNPLLYTRARKAGYRVIVKVAGEPFTGIVVVRKDSRIRHLGGKGLPKGLKIGFPDPNAYAATVMVRQYMRSLGLSVKRDFKVRYFGSQNSALMAVYYGLVDMAGTWFPSLRSMPAKVRRDLRVVAETPPQPQMPIAVRSDMPPRVAARLRHLLTHLTNSAQGRRVLDHLGFKQGFVAATNREYDGVKP